MESYTLSEAKRDARAELVEAMESMTDDAKREYLSKTLDSVQDDIEWADDCGDLESCVYYEARGDVAAEMLDAVV